MLSPLLLIIALLIKIDSKGPVLFKQKRVGKNNKYFNIYKFRTMRTDAPKDSATDQLDNPKAWITKVGSVLRKTSLDELPQLINILLGQMSIVGPRPALWNQFNLNELREQAGVHSIRPGLTGLAQINGRDENDDKEKVYWDSIYLKEYSVIFDVKCIINTLISVVKKEGIVEGGILNDEKNSNNG